jgi:transcriptional regulator with XRE-family HTH domain
MKKIASIIAEKRKQNHLSQADLAALLTKNGFKVSNKTISKWENGQCEPSPAVFIEICRILEIPDIYEIFYGTNPHNPVSKLNEEGQQKVFEYASLLYASGLFNKPTAQIIPFERNLKLYYEPVSAGPGNFLTSDHYELISVGKEVSADADFALHISGDSMEPRFIDGQIVFIHQQNTLENGDIGIFYLDGDAYIKKLQHDDTGIFLISLNKKYDPIPVKEHSSFTVLGKVVG